MSAYRDEQLRPSFPPKLPLAQYPVRCPQCRALVDRFGPLTTFVGNVIIRAKCKNGHEWIEVRL